MKLTKSQFTELIKEEVIKSLMEGRISKHSISYMVDDPNDPENEIEATVDFNYTPAVPGVWYTSNGDPGDAPEPAEVNITSIRDINGNKISVSDEKFQEIENFIYDNHEED